MLQDTCMLESHSYTCSMQENYPKFIRLTTNACLEGYVSFRKLYVAPVRCPELVILAKLTSTLMNPSFLYIELIRMYGHYFVHM